MLQLFVENKVEPITVNELLYYFSLLRSYSTRAHSFQHLLFSISFVQKRAILFNKTQFDAIIEIFLCCMFSNVLPSVLDVFFSSFESSFF